MLNICFITDENYIMPTMVAIKSLIANSKHDLSIYIVTSSLCNDSQQLFKQLETNSAKINIIFAQNPGENISTKHDYVSKTALLKFALPDIFKNLDKILYLDGDVIILEDLKNLYDIDLKDNYVGAVVDINVCNTQTHYKNEGLEKYFNSGVMLLNLSKMRTENTINQLIENKNNDKYKIYMDQDAFNFTFREKVKYLPLKYNFLKFAYNKANITSYLNITEEEYNDVEKSIVICHFAGVIMNNIVEMLNEKDFQLWYKYFNMLPDSNFKTNKAISFCMQYLKIQNQNLAECKKIINNLQEEMNSVKKYRFLKKIFSIKTVENHKIITILGIKIKIKKR